MRRLVVVASAVVAGAVVALALAGCGSDPDPTTPGAGTPDVAATSPATEPEPGGGNGGTGSGCGVISVEQVSEILGEPYVETSTGIEGAGPDGAYTEDGVSGFACLFSPADGDVHDLSITTFSDASDMYNGLAEGDPIDGLGLRAQLFRDDIEVMVIAEGTNHTVAMVILTSLDGSPVEDQVVEITRIVLGAA